MSRLAVALRISAYRAYTTRELQALLRTWRASGMVERVPTAQQAYNIVAIRVAPPAAGLSRSSAA